MGINFIWQEIELQLEEMDSPIAMEVTAASGPTSETITWQNFTKYILLWEY